ncbi:MAG TPA: LptA/OstA family protein [bacterium]|nr:LptA/OstA family protein [bacterium]
MLCFIFACGDACFSAEKTAAAPGVAKQPTVITADGGLYLDYTKNIALFKQNVVVKDAQGFMKADEMKVYFDPKGSAISKIEAFGNVSIDQTGRQAESQKVVMYMNEGKIVLTGDPRIKQGTDTYSAEKITIFKKTNQIIFQPKAKLIIYQDGKGDIF